MISIARLLDSDIVIDLEHQHPPALAWLASALAGSLALPGYAVLELYQEAPNKAQMVATEKIIQDLPVAWPLPSDCRHRTQPKCPSLHLQPQAFPPYPWTRYGAAVHAVAGKSTKSKAA